MIIISNERTIKILIVSIFSFFIIGALTFYGHKKALPVASRNKPLKGRVIVIDPGHGGVDAGVCYDNLKEKEINLDIAHRLKYLLANKGAKVVMTRSSDMALDHYNRSFKSRHKRDLKARVDIINRAKPDIFISLHVNYYPKKMRISGPIVFYQDKRGENKILAQKIQGRLNKVIYKGVDIANNSIRKGDYYILNDGRFPGVLIEVAFINKKIDNWLLKEDEFKNIFVYNLYRGVLDYLYQK